MSSLPFSLYTRFVLRPLTGCRSLPLCTAGCPGSPPAASAHQIPEMIVMPSIFSGRDWPSFVAIQRNSNRVGRPHSLPGRIGPTCVRQARSKSRKKPRQSSWSCPPAYHSPAPSTSSLALNAASNARWRLIGFAAFPMPPPTLPHSRYFNAPRSCPV
jgi:hypothetical protein